MKFYGQIKEPTKNRQATDTLPKNKCLELEQLSNEQSCNHPNCWVLEK